MNLFGPGKEREVAKQTAERKADLSVVEQSTNSLPTLICPTRRETVNHDQKALPGMIGVSQTGEGRALGMSFNPSGQNLPAKVSEFQNFGSSPFWNADGIYGNGERTMDFSTDESAIKSNDQRTVVEEMRSRDSVPYIDFTANAPNPLSSTTPPSASASFGPGSGLGIIGTPFAGPPGMKSNVGRGADWSIRRYSKLRQLRCQRTGHCGYWQCRY